MEVFSSYELVVDLFKLGQPCTQNIHKNLFEKLFSQLYRDISSASTRLAPRIAMGVMNNPIFKRSVILVLHPYRLALSIQRIPASAPNVVKFAPRFEPMTSEYAIAVFICADKPACCVMDSIMAVIGMLLTRLHRKAEKSDTEKIAAVILLLKFANSNSPA